MPRPGFSILIVAALALAPVAPAAAGERAGERPAISISAVRTAPATGAAGVVREFTVSLQETAGGAVQRFVVQGPYKLLDPDEKPRAQVVGRRLLVWTDALIAVFDLESGERLLDLGGAPGVVAAADGRRVAFETSQLPFTAPEAESSVIQVLDVPSGAVEPVFPERSLIEPSQLGVPTAWIEDPAARHFAGPLALSPDGSRLAFFCDHGGALAEGAPREVFLVVADLPADLAASRFVHEAFDWQAHLRRPAAAGEREPYFAVESLAWTEDGGLAVRTPSYAPWLEPEFTVAPPEAGGGEGRP